MADIKLAVQERNVTGKNKVDKLRQEKLIPGVIYRKGEDNLNVKMLEKDFVKVLEEAGTSALVDLQVGDGDEVTVLIKDFQKHAYKNHYLHADFQTVKMDEKLRLMIPVVLLNRDDIRLQPSVLMQLLEEVEIECLPGDIPQTADVDVQDMQYGDTMTVDDLDIASNSKLDILTDREEPVCSLSEPQEEEELDEEETAEVDPSAVPEIGEEDEEKEESEEE